MAQPTEQLKTLKSQRGGNRGFINSLVQKIRELTQSDEITENLKLRALSYREMLQQKSQVLNNIHTNTLELLSEEKDIVDEINNVSEFELLIQEQILLLDRWLSIDSVQNFFGAENPSHVAKCSPAKSHLKLPQIELETFDGNPLHWESFWDVFKSTIHDNNSIDDIVKFTYLRKSLTGKAADALKGLTLTSNNYRNACKILVDRFADPQVVISANIDQLLELSPVKSSKNIEHLRNLFDKIEIHTRNLELLDVNSEHYGPILISLIMNKLPEDLRLDISRKMKPGKWTLSDLLFEFKNELTAREMCSSVATKDCNDSPPSEDLEFTGTNLFVSGNKMKISCSYCGNSHTSKSCQIILLEIMEILHIVIEILITRMILVP